MSMNDGISILLAIFVIVLVFRWLLGTTPPPNNRRLHNSHEQSRARPRPITPEMVETVCAMFPNIPPAAIQFDLQKTGSVEVTCDNILRDGGLPLPPPPTVPNIPSTSNVPSSSTPVSSSNVTQQSLVHRYKLYDAIAKNVVPDEPPKHWESTAEKRHELLQKRKEAMILRARKRYMEQETKKQADSQAKSQVPFSSSNFQFTPSKTSPLHEPDIRLDSEEQANPEARRQQMLQAAELRMGFGSEKKS